jgi:DNA-binding transcriptional MerR regulator
MDIVRLRRQGMSVGAIAKKLKIRKERVCELVAQLHTDWRERVASEYDTLMAEEVGELYMLRASAYDSFAKSQTGKNKAGSSKWLELARRATADLTSLLGLNDRELFEMRRAAPVDPEQARNTEFIVDREDLEQLRDSEGNYRFSAYSKKMKQAAPESDNRSTAAGG